MQDTPITKTQVLAAIESVKAIAEAIRDVGSICDGTLYASLLTMGITLKQYEALLAILIKGKLIARSNGRLTWIGGTPRNA